VWLLAMPTNLPPEYKKVELRYREAESDSERIAYLEEMYSIVPKHKGTDKLRADLRRKLSKLKAAAQTKKKAGKHESAFSIDKEGAGQIVLVGHTNVGKSALVAALTNAEPEVSEFPFTTWKPSPGMMPIDNIQVQLIDTPPLNRDFVEPEFMDMIRRSDLILLMVDLQAEPITQLEQSLALLEENRIVPTQRIEEFPEEQRLTFVPLLILVNKIDDETFDEDFEVFKELCGEDCSMVPLSVKNLRNIDELKNSIFDLLEIIRVYSKAPGREPDFTAPFVLEKGETVEGFARKVHLDFYEKLKAARIWGIGVYDGQLVGRDHVLHDSDVVELRI
jgi:small GTP-binding protein